MLRRFLQLRPVLGLRPGLVLTIFALLGAIFGVVVARWLGLEGALTR